MFNQYKISELLGLGVSDRAGPYETLGFVLTAAILVFGIASFTAKFPVLQICATLLTAIAGGAAAYVYYFNQIAIEAPVAAKPMYLYFAALIYGTVLGVIRIKKELGRRKISRASEQVRVEKFGDKNYRNG